MPSSSLKYSLAFLSISAWCMFGIWMSYPHALALPLALFAFAFVVVAVAYGIRSPQLLGKSGDGRTRFWQSIILLPYLVLNRICFELFCLTDRSPAWAEVVPGVLLGRRLRNWEAAELPAGRVIDLTSEFAESSALRRRVYTSAPMLDGVAPSLNQLSRAVELLRNSVKDGTTYLHCALGHGRSGTVAVAYLIAEGRAKTVDEGLQLVCSARPSIRLSRGQRALLDRWAAKKECNK
jgi:hypothetical protein